MTHRHESRNRRDDGTATLSAAARREALSTGRPGLTTDSVAPPGTSTVQLKALDAALLQFRANVLQRAEDDPHAKAAGGMAGSRSSLPHLQAIQRSFGRHDVSSVPAFRDAGAHAAAESLGAKAYATNGAVVLGRGGDDLHTVAHEAAHVVQQRGGIRLKSNMGKAGDRHEQHADAVADAVVQGRSAEGLLDRYVGPTGASGAPGSALQCHPGDHPPPTRTRGMSERDQELLRQSRRRAAGEDDSSLAGAAEQATRTEGADGEEQEGIDLESIRVSAHIPGGTVLSTEWSRTVRTSSRTRISLTLSADRLMISFFPPLLIVPIRPMQEMHVNSVRWSFRGQSAEADVACYGPEIMEGRLFDASGMAEGTFEEMLTNAIRPTLAGAPGYNPLRDQQLQETAGDILNNFRSSFGSGGGGGGDAEEEEEAPEASDPSLQATFTTRAPVQMAQDETQVSIPGGTQTQVTVAATGSVNDAAESGTAAGAARALQFEQLTLHSAIEISREGRPVVRITDLQIAHGGEVDITGHEWIMPQDDSQPFTDLMTMLFGEGFIEGAFTRAVRELVMGNRNAVPGVDLGDVFGVSGE